MTRCNLRASRLRGRLFGVSGLKLCKSAPPATVTLVMTTAIIVVGERYLQSNYCDFLHLPTERFSSIEADKGFGSISLHSLYQGHYRLPTIA